MTGSSFLSRFFSGNTPVDLVNRYGSPVYVYSERVLRERVREIRNLVTLPGFQPYFSTKSNGNPFLLRIIREEGLRADAMSPGEVAMLKAAGFTKEEIGYVCNNVSGEELAFAAKEAAWVSVDSLDQLVLLGKNAPGCKVIVRVNPGIGAGHHAKVVTAGKHTKFGVHREELPHALSLAKEYGLHVVGLNQHVGSLFLDAEPYLAAAKWLLDVAETLDNLEIIDFGGGFGIPYKKDGSEARLDLADLGERLTAMLNEWCARTGYEGQFFIEPGRYVVAECGVLLGQVYAVKENSGVHFVGTDIGFSVLARPVLYDAYHEVEACLQCPEEREKVMQTIVGNICESGDILARDRLLPALAVQDVIAVRDAGAYGMAMSSNYNQRLRPAEVLITDLGEAKLIRKRDTEESLLQPYRCIE